MTQWSAQQKDIFNWFKNGGDNLVVRARAGTGKTTTIVEAVKFAPEERILLAAFNKKIAVELEERLPAGATAKTLHSLGFGFVRSYWNDIRIDSAGKRAWAIAEVACEGAPDDVRKEVVKLSAKLKAMMPMAGVGCSKELVAFEQMRQVVDIADRFGISMDEEWEQDGYTVEYLAKAARQMLIIGKDFRDGTIDFDDMVWLPVRNKWVRPRFDLVVIDEAQDMNRTQIDLAMGVCSKKGRICVVGDDRQAIYGFRGADSGSIDRLKESLEAKEMGLTTTYRCGKRIVAEAKRLVPDFQDHESNGQGVVRSTNIGICIEEAAVGDFILSRTNAPLVSVCLKLLRDGKPANIEGRDVGKGLENIVKKLNKGPARSSFKKFCKRLDSWLDAEVKRAQLRGEKGEATIARVLDQHETLCFLLDGLTSADELLKRISSLFADTKGKGQRIILSSVHKSKGLEARRVWLLKDTFFSRMPEPPKWADFREEANIEYVAITRAKEELVWVVGRLMRCDAQHRELAFTMLEHYAVHGEECPVFMRAARAMEGKL